MSEWVKKREREVHIMAKQKRQEAHRLSQKETCHQKKQYGSEANAQEHCDKTSTPYLCFNCRTWHLTTKVKKEENKNNFLHDVRGQVFKTDLLVASVALRKLFFIAREHGHGPKTRFEDMSTYLNDLAGKY